MDKLIDYTKFHLLQTWAKQAGICLGRSAWQKTHWFQSSTTSCVLFLGVPPVFPPAGSLRRSNCRVAPFVPAAGIQGDVGEGGLRFHVSASSPFLFYFPPLNLGVQCCWEKRLGDQALKEMNLKTEQESSGSSYFYLVTENKFLLLLDDTPRQDKMLEALKCYVLSANTMKNVALEFQILGIGHEDSQ